MEEIFANQSSIEKKWSDDIAQLRRDHAAAKASGVRGAAASIKVKINKAEEALRRLTSRGCTVG